MSVTQISATTRQSHPATQTKQLRVRRPLQIVTAIIVASVPFLGITSMNNVTNAASVKCVKTIKGVSVCAESKGQGYEIYSKLGPITSQKQYVGKDGGCATFGTVDVAGTRAQAKGCLKINPVRMEGKVEACFLKKCKSDDFSLNLQ
ncbi:hypothetical protein [Calothrix sp. PCC 7507]|uniref:hypothetical protein n=1 Tax=Calothrix sp. PCC 7507 TaxID=99598 RepID=UPI00029EE4CA|nr:hypothetical protein [Calothrix sp. PCC 7507]AFY31928.1 hypothetical protein Cal7507_1463 [Calothrix sp. PCC 7507]